MSTTPDQQEGQWRLGPQDEVGRWIFKLAPDDPFAIHGVVGFHVGGVYGDKGSQERVRDYLNALEATITRLTAERDEAVELLGRAHRLIEAHGHWVREDAVDELIMQALSRLQQQGGAQG